MILKSPDIPSLNEPNDVDTEFEVAIDTLVWYKLYNEHHYWTLWETRINEEAEKEWTTSSDEEFIAEK